MELYGQAQPVVYGDSIIRGGSVSGLKWNAPVGFVTKVGFDPKGILWALAGSPGTPLDLIYLMPGARHFKIGKRNLSVDGFLLDADRAVMTDAVVPSMSDSSKSSEEKLAAYPVLTKDSQTIS
jgi:hypothetical protein